MIAHFEYCINCTHVFSRSHEFPLPSIKIKPSSCIFRSLILMVKWKRQITLKFLKCNEIKFITKAKFTLTLILYWLNSNLMEIFFSQLCYDCHCDCRKIERVFFFFLSFYFPFFKMLNTTHNSYAIFFFRYFVIFILSCVLCCCYYCCLHSFKFFFFGREN